MREIIDIDQLSQWCVPVRVRGHLIETRNPLRGDMTLLDTRIKRGDYESDAELSAARKKLLDEMIDAMFVGDEWGKLKEKIAAGQEEPLSMFEKLSIVLQYSIAHEFAVNGREAAARLGERPFTLIEDESPVAPATAASPAVRKRDLPPGLIIGGDGGERPISEANLGVEELAAH
ncbi:MAG: hypothetical protein IT430_09885 [Phycisphaerales bacterium]|nr:hypothetical protein [Phycisphaerales bacterium]